MPLKSEHRILSVILRVGELICSVIVLGLVAHFIRLVSDAGGSNDGRLIYTLIVASISTLFSVLFLPPFLYSFLGFAADFILFIGWMVAFALLANRTITGTCDSYWYYDYWGYYWGGWWDNDFNYYGSRAAAGCSQWRVVLAFSFIASIIYLLSGILGARVIFKYYRGSKDRGVISGPTPVGGPVGGPVGEPQTSQVPGSRPTTTPAAQV
ncbi:hypothetical protein OQA88_11853 [Cercophora sp. LCS_1]